jgi:predicted Zn-dependent peptidase
MRNFELAYGFKLPHYDMGFEILNIILGRWSMGKLWQDRFTKNAFTIGSRVEWTSTGGGLIVNFGLNPRASIDEIDKDFCSILENLNVDQTELQIAKRTRTLEILRAIEEGETGLLNFITHPSLKKDRNIKETKAEIDRVEKASILSLTANFLNKENAVKVVVGPRR